MIKGKFSDKYYAKNRRVANLPEMYIGMIKGNLRKDALAVVRNFQKGIKGNEFGLKALADGTIERKRRQALDLPATPLYGKGLKVENKSYINMLRIRELKNGYKVYPSEAYHHSGKVKLKLLFYVHEYGTMIKQGKAIIKIQPRPALFKAYQQTMTNRARDIRERSRQVKRAVFMYINEATNKLAAQIENQEEFAVKRLME